jgi:hypothetical protein
MTNEKLRREMAAARKLLAGERGDYERLLHSIDAAQCAGNMDQGDGPGVSAFASREPDVDVTPLSVGFDPRVHQMPVEIESKPELTVRYDRQGHTMTVTGDPAKIKRTLRTAGYRVVFAEAPVNAN